MWRRTALDGGVATRHELNCEDLLREQVLLKQQQHAINEKQLELRRREVLQQERLQERERLVTKRLEHREEQCKMLVQIHEESLKAALLQLEERTAQKHEAKTQELHNTNQMFQEQIRGKFVQAQSALQVKLEAVQAQLVQAQSAFQTELEAANAQHLQCQTELQKTKQQLHDESHSRQVAEEKLTELCNRVLVISERQRETQRHLNAEWERCVANLLNARQIQLTQSVSGESTLEAVNEEMESTQPPTSESSAHEESEAAAQTVNVGQTPEPQSCEPLFVEQEKKEEKAEEPSCEPLFVEQEKKEEKAEEPSCEQIEERRVGKECRL